MQLPNADAAVVSRDKIVGYLLNSQHPDSAGKAAFFSAMGFHVDSWRQLADALIKLVTVAPVALRVDSPHGSKYIVDGAIDTPSGRSASVRTVWIVDHGNHAPRLVTAYPRQQEK